MAEEAAWVGNLIKAIIAHYIGGFLMGWNVIFNVLGMNSFGYDTLMGLGLYGGAVTSAEIVFN